MQFAIAAEAVDGGLEVDDAHGADELEATLGEDGEEALVGVAPTGRGRREVERPSRMTPEPLDHLGVIVGASLSRRTFCLAQCEHSAKFDEVDDDGFGRSLAVVCRNRLPEVLGHLV